MRICHLQNLRTKPRTNQVSLSHINYTYCLKKVLIEAVKSAIYKIHKSVSYFEWVHSTMVLVRCLTRFWLKFHQVEVKITFMSFITSSSWSSFHANIILNKRITPQVSVYESLPIDLIQMTMTDDILTRAARPEPTFASGQIPSLKWFPAQERRLSAPCMKSTLSCVVNHVAQRVIKSYYFAALLTRLKLGPIGKNEKL